MKKAKEFMSYVIIILVVVLIRTFIVTPVRVDGDSMVPTFKNGQILILNKLDRKYERMDVVVFKYKGDRLIKRVIGLPGEAVEFKDNKLYINGVITEDMGFDTSDYNLNMVIPENYYFLVGDNRSNSLDSRIIGLISKDKIIGTVNFKLIPIGRVWLYLFILLYFK